jgi:hypothetical protein
MRERARTFARPEERDSSRYSDQGRDGQDEVGKELTLLIVVVVGPGHFECVSLTTVQRERRKKGNSSRKVGACVVKEYTVSGWGHCGGGGRVVSDESSVH